MMGKDNRPWRKLVKKQQRSRRRKARAGISDSANAAEIKDKVPKSCSTIVSDSDSSPEESDSDTLERLQHDADEIAYLEREKQAQIRFERKAAILERKRRAEEAERCKMKAEFETMREKDRILKEERKILEEIKQAEKEEKFNQLLEFLSGDIENPPKKFLMPELMDELEAEPCFYYSTTAACRFFDRCKGTHAQPTLSDTILIQNFFSHFYIQHGLSTNEYETDLTLEYEESDLYKEFLRFYQDVLPEFRAVGNVVQFKVCCNFEPHLRGNVYVQYDSIKESVQAYRVFNARFYGGKQLTVQFVRIPSWKRAICSQFSRKRCVKGRSCNYLHVFRSPTTEFVPADNDWPKPPIRHAVRKRNSKTNGGSRTHGGSSSSSSSRHQALPIPIVKFSSQENHIRLQREGSSTTSDPDRSTPETSPVRAHREDSCDRTAPDNVELNKDFGSYESRKSEGSSKSSHKHYGSRSSADKHKSRESSRSSRSGDRNRSVELDRSRENSRSGGSRHKHRRVDRHKSKERSRSRSGDRHRDDKSKKSSERSSRSKHKHHRVHKKSKSRERRKDRINR